MRVGDLVKHIETNKVGVVVRVFMHKMWKTSERGPKVNFSTIKPEPFAEVQFGKEIMKVPQSDLEYM